MLHWVVHALHLLAARSNYTADTQESNRTSSNSCRDRAHHCCLSPGTWWRWRTRWQWRTWWQRRRREQLSSPSPPFPFGRLTLLTPRGGNVSRASPQSCQFHRSLWGPCYSLCCALSNDHLLYFLSDKAEDSIAKNDGDLNIDISNPVRTWDEAVKSRIPIWQERLSSSKLYVEKKQ